MFGYFTKATKLSIITSTPKIAQNYQKSTTHSVPTLYLGYLFHRIKTLSQEFPGRLVHMSSLRENSRALLRQIFVSLN